MNYESAYFFLEGSLEGPYAGYTQPGIDWNGWAVPHFERTAADRIASDFIESGKGQREGLPSADYNADRDSFFFYDPAFPENHIEAFGEEIDVGGRVVKVYPIGAWAWTWERVA